MAWRSRQIPGSVVTLAVVLAAGCQPGSPADSGEPADADPTTQALDVDGTFQVEFTPPTDGSGQASILGRVFDGPTPSPVIWEVADSDGVCELRTPRIPFCDPDCEGTDACVEDGECAAYPSVVEVGDVTVDGVHTTDGATGFTMEPIAGYYQPPAAIDLAYPPFSEGDTVTFSAAGNADTAPFTMTSSGIAAIDVTTETVHLEDGTSVEVEWTPAADPDLSTVVVSINISYHAGTKGIIRCEAPDDGALELSGGMLDGLKALGVSGWPMIVYSRTSTSVTVPDAPVTLLLESSVTRDVTIPGVTSCNSDLDCPEGQTCQADFQCG